MKAETLKKSILQYAMEGKLVAQNPNDEPASELLKRIKAEKEQLIKDGKIKKEKPLSPITEEEIPYELPQGWEWVRLGEIGLSNIGLTYKPTDITLSKSGIPVLRSSNIQNNKIDLNDLVRVTTEIKNENLYVQKGDVLICARNGSKSLVGKSAIIKELIEPMTFGAFMAIFRSNINEWVKVYLDSPLFKKTLESVNTVTINQITQNNLKNAIIPLPPLEEQKRIVEKLEQILPLVDEYGKNEEKLAELNKTLPPKIKQSILQHAVQGKLVEQNPNEEPASELLKRIKAEKEQLIKDGKIKKEKQLSPITEDEIPYELPQGWEWVRLGEILNIARGGSPRPIQAFITNAKDGLNWIKIGDTDKGGKYINSTKEKIIKEGLSKTRFVKKGDFLLSNSMSFGRPYILNIDGCIHDGWLVLSNVDKCFNKDFLYYLLSSYYMFQQFCGKVSGAVVKNLNSEKVAEAIVALPPLEEQKRIVAKVDELMQIVDKLEI